MEPMPEVLELYREYLMDKKRSRTTAKKYLRDVRKFLGYLGDNGRVDKEEVREFKQEPMGHYKINNVNSMLAAVSSFLGSIGRGDLKVKLLKVQKAVYSRPEREMTEKEYGGSVRTAKQLRDSRVNILLQTIGSMGIRISRSKFITMESLETGWTEIYNKGGSQAVLLSVELTRLLKEYCRKAGIYTRGIFIARQEDPLDRSNMSKKTKQLGREAGVDVARAFPRSLHRLFARVFCSVEKDVVRLMDLPGHSSTSIARIYTMTTKEQPRRQVSRMKLAPE